MLPERVSAALANDVCGGHPSLLDHEVFEILSHRKLTGGVVGDLDPRVVKECLVELSHPLACVYRSAVENHEWPDAWKQEKQVMIPKCPKPDTKDDMRNLGLSPFFNKGLEQVLVDWLLPYVSKYLSRDQLGGRKNCGTNHYLARLFNYIYSEIDAGKPGDRRAVATMCVDLSKVFNRLDHGKLIVMLFDMGIPVCAI